MDVAITVWKLKDKDTKFRTFIAKAIAYFTGYPYTHVAIYLGGTTYESTVWKEGRKHRSGIRSSEGLMEADYMVHPPEDIVTEDFIRRLSLSCLDSLKIPYTYNFLKLLGLIFIWPTRWIWKKIGWVPFSSAMRGKVCSVYVDTMFKQAGVDIFPKDLEGYTVPGEFMHIKGWDVMEVTE